MRQNEVVRLYRSEKLNGRALEQAILLELTCDVPLPLIARIIEESEKTADQIIGVFKGEIERICIGGSSERFAGSFLSEQIAQTLGWKEPVKLGVQRGLGLEEIFGAEKEFREWLTRARTLISIGLGAASH